MTGTFLGEAAAHDAVRVGAKAATLSRLAARFRVPAGFCLDATAFERLRSALDSDTSARAALRDLVAAAHAELERRTGRERPALAVRSSAIGEDGGTDSFAGQHDTILGVRGVDGVVDAVLRCWASASSERAVAYRRERGIGGPPAVAVLVQELVDADVAAIAFSADPVSGDDSVVVVNASWGLGESLASGGVTPDMYVVRKVDLAVVRREIADKRVMTVRQAGGAAETPVPDDRRQIAALDDEGAREVARLAIALATEHGAPVDVECAFAGGALYLLQSRPITTLRRPDAFPVSWDDPAEAELTWTREEAHMAEARPRLSAEYTFHGPQVGLNRRSEMLGLPVRFRYKTFNSYLYESVEWQVAPAEVPAIQQRALGYRRELARRLRPQWDKEILPALDAHYAALRALTAGVAGRSPADAVAAWDEVWARMHAVWTTHMFVTGGSYAVMDELAATYETLTGRPATEALVLVQGLAGTLQALERDLYGLTRTVRAHVEAAAAIASGAARSLTDVTLLPDGALVAGAIETFLSEWGDAGQLGLDIRAPAWRDDPELLIAELARRLRTDASDPVARLARLRAESDALATRTRELLRDRLADLARFEEVLGAARAAGPLTEEHNYWIDRLIQAHVRRAVLAFGARLAQGGAIGDAADVFHFTVPEVRELLLESGDRRAVVRERERELRWAEGLTPPRTLGTSVTGPDAANASMMNLGYRAAQDSGDAAVLKGVPASAGVARGPVRLVRDPSRFEDFEKGDVLVCRSSNVSWVPLFALAAAVVTDVGGALSHAAVVAREFGVPAVVGTGVALDTLVDGEPVEVDGLAGTVRRLRP